MTTWNPRANELFLAARELRSPAERGEFLDRACAGDAVLRAEVEALLEAGDRAGDFLQSPAPAVTVDQQPLAERPGAVVGPYKLLEQIGEGGFGVVFMAEQTRAGAAQGRPQVHQARHGLRGRSSPGSRRSGRPWRSWTTRTSPGCSTAARPDSGRPYFVMELVKGVPITKYCDENHLTPRQRLELFVPVCQAVQHAHQKGIIHRDLKPSNVLVTVHDGVPVPKVIDFGVAKAAGQQLTDKTLFTGFAPMIGTPLYMSPGAGRAERPGHRHAERHLLPRRAPLRTPDRHDPVHRERSWKAGLLEIRRIIREEEPPRSRARG